MAQDISFNMHYTDMLGRAINLPKEPQRIICLVPSLTELLYDLGLDNRVVGITKFCIRPKSWYNSKSRVGGTKSLNHDKIKALNPDLIIANKEENTKEEIEALSKDYPIWISDINNYKEALLAIQLIGEICHKREQSKELIRKITHFKNNYKLTDSSKKKVLYIIWKNPYMAVGTSTYINDILKHLGYINCYTKTRYQEITIEEIKSLNPDLILFSSEPYPFKPSDLIELKNKLPFIESKLVDGELVSWYGSRLIDTFSKSIFLS